MASITADDRKWMHDILDEALAGDFEFNVGRDVMAVSCEDAGCVGCSFLHRKLTGPKRLVIEWPVNDG